jgi:hypothetical protein
MLYLSLCCWLVLALSSCHLYVDWHSVLSWLNRNVLRSVCLLQAIYIDYFDSTIFGCHSVMLILCLLLVLAKFILWSDVWFVLMCFSRCQYLCMWTYFLQSWLLHIRLVHSSTPAEHYLSFVYAIVLILLTGICYYLCLLKIFIRFFHCYSLFLYCPSLCWAFWLFLWCVYALILRFKRLPWMVLCWL